MKKLLLLLACVLCFALVACGNNETNESIEITFESNEDEFKGEVIEFNNTVLIDDDLVRIELVKFYTSENYSDEDDTPHKSFCFKCTNKSDDYEMDIYPIDCYVEDEMVNVVMIGANNIMPGKTAYYDYYVEYERSEDRIQLDSLDNLYDLEGKIHLTSYYDDTFDWIEYDLSFKDLK